MIWTQLSAHWLRMFEGNQVKCVYYRWAQILWTPNVDYIEFMTHLQLYTTSLQISKLDVTVLLPSFPLRASEVNPTICERSVLPSPISSIRRLTKSLRSTILTLKGSNSETKAWWSLIEKYRLTKLSPEGENDVEFLALHEQILAWYPQLTSSCIFFQRFSPNKSAERLSFWCATYL